MPENNIDAHTRLRLRRGRTIALSLPRRFVGDVLHFSQRIPTVPMERHMDLSELIALRATWANRPSWCAIFLKAYALVAAERPELRRSYLSLPWHRLYEHPENVASFAIEREYRGEASLFFARVTRPERMSLELLDALVKHHKTAPIESIASFRHALSLARLPRFLRRLLWRGGLDIDGMLRSCLFGTLTISTAASRGAAGLHILSPLTTTLNYSPFDADGNTAVRIAYDHRVVDGGAIADALVEVEKTLHTVIVDELATGARATASRRDAAANSEVAAQSAANLRLLPR